jgi:hypothetical protein
VNVAPVEMANLVAHSAGMEEGAIVVEALVRVAQPNVDVYAESLYDVMFGRETPASGVRVVDGLWQLHRLVNDVVVPAFEESL